MPFAYSENEWPLLIIEASGESSDEDLDRYIGTLSKVLARCEPHVVIVDATRGQNLKGTHRRRVAAWNQQNEVALKKYRVGLVLVTESSVLRGLITAVYWLFSPPFPYVTANSIEEARRWAYHKLGMSDWSRQA